MPTVAIVGAGLIGRAWANVFARAGWDVRLWDPDAAALAAAPRLIEEALHDVARHGLAKDAAAAARRVTTAAPWKRRWQDAEFVQENGPERVEVKREVFARLDAAAPPSAILASSSSAIVASRFTEDLKGRAPLPDRASGEPAARGADRGAVRARRGHRPRRSSAPAPSMRASARCRSR